MELNNKVNTYYICATQTNNLGDLMINKMLVDELCKYGKVYLDVFGIPDEFKYPLLKNKNVIDTSTFGFTVKRLSINNLYKYIVFLKKNNVKLITRSPGPLEEPSKKVRLGFSIINKIANLFKVRVVYFGNCCSEALSNSHKLKSTYMNEIYVRSQNSLEYAKKFISCTMSYIPDMAYLMVTPKVYEKKKIVIVDYREVADANEVSIADLRLIVRDFRLLGYAVELYYQVKSDKEGMLSLYDLLKDEGVKMRQDLLWYDDIEEYYSDKAFVISNRLHSLLFGAVYGVIPIARISNDPHISKIMHVFRSSLSELFYNNIYLDKPLNVRNLVDNEVLYRNILRSNMKYNRNKCSEVINKVLRNISR